MKNNSEKKRPRNAIGLYIGLQATDKSFRLFHTQEAYSGIPGRFLQYCNIGFVGRTFPVLSEKVISEFLRIESRLPLKRYIYIYPFFVLIHSTSNIEAAWY